MLTCNVAYKATLPDSCTRSIVQSASHSHKAQMPLVLSALDKVLEGKSFLENDEFGVADVAVGGCLLYARDGMKMKTLADYKNIDRYINEVSMLWYFDFLLCCVYVDGIRAL